MTQQQALSTQQVRGLYDDIKPEDLEAMLNDYSQIPSLLNKTQQAFMNQEQTQVTSPPAEVQEPSSLVKELMVEAEASVEKEVSFDLNEADPLEWSRS
jgi:hypothetical protein